MSSILTARGNRQRAAAPSARKTGAFRTGRAAAAGLAGVLSLLPACSPPAPTVFDGPPGVRILDLPTYEGSGQAVHPDVIRVDGDGLPGPYWMAVTPYPFSDEKLENPCVYRSPDGLAWTEPAPGVNPVVPRPRFDHNSDPDLVRWKGEFRLFYLTTQRREYRPDDRHYQLLRVVRSRDGRTWSSPADVARWELEGEPFYLSPAVVESPEGWRLYLVDREGERIVWLPSADLESFGAPAGSLEVRGADFRPWHVDVFRATDGWIALVCGREPDAPDWSRQHLWIGASPDLERWMFRKEPLLAPGPGLLDTESVYRSSGLLEKDRLAVWFSARTVPGRWLVAVTTADGEMIRRLLAEAGRLDR